MNYLYKTISAKAIIGGAMSDFGIADSNLHLDAMEWIGDGIADIGYHIGFINKVEKVEVKNHSFDIPCDMVQLNYIVYKGRKLRKGMVHGYKSGSYSRGGDDPLFTELVQLVKARENSLCFAEGIGEDSPDNCDCEPILDETELERTNVKIKALMEGFNQRPNNSCQEYFIKQDECYKTSIEEGELYIHYKAYPVTKDGYPLVIDEVKYKRALKFTIMWYLTMRGYRHPVLTFTMLEELKERAIARARNEHSKQTYEDMERFMNSWSNLLFSIGKSSNFYSNG